MKETHCALDVDGKLWTWGGGTIAQPLRESGKLEVFGTLNQHTLKTLQVNIKSEFVLNGKIYTKSKTVFSHLGTKSLSI